MLGAKTQTKRFQMTMMQPYFLKKKLQEYSHLASISSINGVDFNQKPLQTLKCYLGRRFDPNQTIEVLIKIVYF